MLLIVLHLRVLKFCLLLILSILLFKLLKGLSYASPFVDVVLAETTLINKLRESLVERNIEQFDIN